MLWTHSTAGAEQYLAANPQLQAAIRRRSGARYVEELLQALGKNQELRAKYVKLDNEEYAKVLPTFPVGQPMLDVALTTLDGKRFKLSELRGKVVYLNIFAAEDHRPMFDRQREFADTMKGKPFVIVNVSVDERKETFEHWLQRDPTPWVNVWCGRRSEVYADWLQQGYHTSYLIDAKGILRERGVFWGDLPDRAEELLAEIRPRAKGTAD
ncbi:MAG TPA: TlpA disulfide reductase family protein [Gemmataceae bacterium]|nr:TlpA disulfide reductase family protein [Gemmataceae bacterium]